MSVCSHVCFSHCVSVGNLSLGHSRSVCVCLSVVLCVVQVVSQQHESVSVLQSGGRGLCHLPEGASLGLLWVTALCPRWPSPEPVCCCMPVSLYVSIISSVTISTEDLIRWMSDVYLGATLYSTRVLSFYECVAFQNQCAQKSLTLALDLPSCEPHKPHKGC